MKKTTLFLIAATVFISFATAKPAKAANFDLIKTASHDEIYINLSWGRYHVKDNDVWNRWGLGWNMIRVISDEAMAKIPQGPDITKALRPFGDPTVYVVENQQMRAVTSAESFLLAGYKWEDVTNVEPAIVNQLPRGENLTSSVVRSPKDGKIYYLWGGQKHHIVSPYVWNQWGFTGYVDSALVDSIPTGSSLTNLVRPYGDPTVWVIDHGKRRALPSPDALLLNNFSWADVVDADPGLILARTVGDTFWAPTTVSTPGSTAVYFVEKGVKYLIKDTDTWNNWGFGNLGFNVSPAIDSYPSGGTLTRLARNETGTVYRIKDQKYKAVPTIGIFEGYGFSWSDVIDLPSSSFGLLKSDGVMSFVSDTLNNISIPATSGRVGLEQHLWTKSGEGDESSHYSLTGVPAIGESIGLGIRNGVAGTGAFGKLDASIEKYYITMRWNYTDWYEGADGSCNSSTDGRLDTCIRNSSGTLKSWHLGKKVIVSNPRNGRKIVTAVGESGPAIWVTREQGVVGGLSPEGIDYLVGMNYNTLGSKDNLQFGWSVDQNLPLGPLNW